MCTEHSDDKRDEIAKIADSIPKYDWGGEKKPAENVQTDLITDLLRSITEDGSS